MVDTEQQMIELRVQERRGARLPGSRAPLEHGPIGWVAARGEAVLVEDWDTGARVPARIGRRRSPRDMVP